MSRADYVANKHREYGFGDLTPHPGDDEGTAWYKAVLLPPERVPVCTKCDLDLRAFRRLKRVDQKERFQFECSSTACLWHDWFEHLRPSDFQKYRSAARQRAVQSGKS